VARIILEDDISEDWSRDQLADSVISVFLKGKKLNRKLFQDLASLDSSEKSLFILLGCFVSEKRCPL